MRSEPSPGRPLDGASRALEWAAATWRAWAEPADGSACGESHRRWLASLAWLACGRRTVSAVTATTCDKCTFRFMSRELARFSLAGALCNCVVRRYVQTFKCSSRDLNESRRHTQCEETKPFGILPPGNSRDRLQGACTAASPRTDFQGESFVLSGVLPESTPTSPVAFASFSCRCDIS